MTLGTTQKITVGQKLRKLRDSTGKTIEKAAEEIGISYQAMQAYETDSRVPRDDVKKKIAKYYNRSIGFIFFDEQ